MLKIKPTKQDKDNYKKLYGLELKDIYLSSEEQWLRYQKMIYELSRENDVN